MQVKPNNRLRMALGFRVVTGRGAWGFLRAGKCFVS